MQRYGGYLNNELYAGRRVWNRQKFLKDPSSGKRVTRYNPSDQLVAQEVPELRIVSDAVWNTVKDRQRKMRNAITERTGIRSERARRPAYLLSGLVRCGVCGGGFSKRSETHYACSTAHDRGTCDNLLRIRRDVLEASVLSGLRTHLMKPELVREFIAEYHRELNRLGNKTSLDRDRQKEELTQIERQIRSVIEAIKDGLRTASMRAELLALEARKGDIAATLAESQPTLVRLHPKLDKVYRERVARLHKELNNEAARAEAAEILRSLIKAIRLIPEGSQLEIELIGDPAAMIVFGGGKPLPSGDAAARITNGSGRGT